MNIKIFSILAIVTALLVLAAVNFSKNPGAEKTPEKQVLFPGLSKQLEDVSEILIQRKDSQFTLQKNPNGVWSLKERDGYPAAVDKVGSLLMGTAGLRTLEAKTSSPALYEKLQVEDISAEKAASTQVTLKKGDGSIVADLIVGKSKPAKIDSTRQEIYVRKVGDKQSWLALGALSVEPELNEWLDKEIVNIDSKRIRSVDLRQGEEQFTIFKQNAEATDFQISDLPDRGKVKSPYLLNNIGGFLADLRFDSVIADAGIDFSKPDLAAMFHRFDGLQAQLSVAQKDGKDYIKLAFSYEAPAEKTEQAQTDEAKKEEAEAEKSKEESTEDSQPDPEKIKQEVADLNAKVRNWAYQLPSYKLDNLRKKHGELISISSADGQADSTAVNPFTNPGTAASSTTPVNPFAAFANRATTQ